jgi:hypothetical protein
MYHAISCGAEKARWRKEMDMGELEGPRRSLYRCYELETITALTYIQPVKRREEKLVVVVTVDSH